MIVIDLLDWFGKADNPAVSFKQVQCPATLTDISGYIYNDDDDINCSVFSVRISLSAPLFPLSPWFPLPNPTPPLRLLLLPPRSSLSPYSIKAGSSSSKCQLSSPRPLTTSIAGPSSNLMFPPLIMFNLLLPKAFKRKLTSAAGPAAAILCLRELKPLQFLALRYKQRHISLHLSLPKIM
ncbi:hypothetical protein BGZ63DRAFT_267156, partial [Mariannaea sp. PMI_226]